MIGDDDDHDANAEALKWGEKKTERRSASSQKKWF